MKNSIIFSFPGNKRFAHYLANQLPVEEGKLVIKRFPDGESYVRINSIVKGKIAILVCTLNNPDKKILPLMFTAQTLKELGAEKIILISPYLPYMRQDKRFKPGEAVTSRLFAKFCSNWVDYLITIDPHLHRVHHLSSIYSIPVLTLHATKAIALWIKENIKSPFLIGPDSESEQWISEVANYIKAPYVLCEKIRLSSHEVKMTIPLFSLTNETIIILDDIVSTGASMIAILKQLAKQGNKNVICLAVHPLLNKVTNNKLISLGAKEIITCNTIRNASNKINITELIAINLQNLLREL